MESSALSRHFDAIASSYRTVRTTDHRHVSHVRRQLPDRPLVGIDIGAGTGRYTEQLLDALAPQSFLVGVDFNHSMLVRLTQQEERHRVPAVRCISEHLAFAGSSADFVTTFNAVHHFDLCQFVNEVARVLKPGGDLFIYTRTPAQNANSIWGRHFPGFISRETRLHDEATFQQALSQFETVNMTCFEFTRRATRARLIDQVRHHHYSTFALYGSDALADALDGFLDNIGETTEQCWQDQNLLVHARLPV